MKTSSHAFFDNRSPLWDQLIRINQKIARSGYKKLTPQEVTQYPRLYRQACGDLAEARLKQLSPELLAYLNQIVACAHENLYKAKGRYHHRGRGISYLFLHKFLGAILPQAMVNHRRILVLSLFLFVFSYCLSFFLVKTDPSLAQVIVPKDVLIMMEGSYSQSIEESRSTLMNSSMFSYYIQHNVSIAFVSFASGVLLGMGTLFFLVYNGLLLGSITGYIFALGYGNNFLNFVTAHSVFELTGLVISGAAGLLLGFTLLAPGNHSRIQALKGIQKELLALVGAAALLISMAAVIEGFISPQPIPYSIKLGVFIISLSLELGYLVFIWRKVRGARP